MQDFLGVEILLGDTVVSYDPKYKQLHWFIVEKFTPKMVRVRLAGGECTTIRLAGELIVVLAKRKVEDLNQPTGREALEKLIICEKESK